MGWWWAGRGTQGRIPSTHNSTFLSTWPCQSPGHLTGCVHIHISLLLLTPFLPSPVSSPIRQTLTFHLIRDPSAKVFTHITLGHIGISHLLTLHLWPLWNAMIHMFAQTPYFGFSQERTSRNPCFPWESWKNGDKSHLIISLIISAGVTVFFLLSYMLAANLRLLVEVMRVDEVVHQLDDQWNNTTSNDNLSLMLMDCIWSKSVLTIYNDYTMIILWNFIFYARLFCSTAFILIFCNKTQARKKTLCRYVYCFQKWSHLQPSKWLHWFSADLCASSFYVHITCPNVDTYNLKFAHLVWLNIWQPYQPCIAL